MSALRKEAVELQEYGIEKDYSPKKRIKTKKKNNTFIESLKNSAMIAITFILGILIVYNYAVITDKQMELNNLSIEITNLNSEIDKYNIALESIKNTNSIEEMAKVYLGMNYPTRKQTVFLDFTYGSDTTEENNIMAKDENLLVGLIDKVRSFIR
ncbi:MAG: cell division protein FtsL [Tissierellia bacterium]|jgi:cell division protein FtsL|nr:cell division protein FtsL [Tissierellia bacterium]MDD3226620.1 cell division protein FtsL [Tissierellia bacterium]MDD3751523.1 cell division protein FtsL [Tissierellia bacterium]MDD4047017.1 cell division protein FtsL [Tissierellia bacterium]